jgi:hypothetical protein
MIRPLPFLLVLGLLAGCSTPPVKVATEVVTVEVPVPVRVPCVALSDIPSKPTRLRAPDDAAPPTSGAEAMARLRKWALDVSQELVEWEIYFGRADTLLHSCTK